MIYSKLGKLREGGFGKIIAIKNKTNGKIYAAKIISIKNVKDHKKRLLEIKNDYRIIKKINLKYNDEQDDMSRIIKYHSLAKHGNETAIIMDLYKPFDIGQMVYYIREHHEDLLMITIDHIILQISVLLKKIHNLNIAHRDIKQSNILANHIDWINEMRTHSNITLETYKNSLSSLNKSNIEQNIIIIMLDFGFSIDKNSPSEIYNNKVGTRSYESPEILRGRISRKSKKTLGISTYTYEDLFFDNSQDAIDFYQKCDVWAFGILIYKLIFSKNIFNIVGTDSTDMALDKILSYDKTTTTKNNNPNKKYIPLIHKCLNIESSKRPNANYIHSILIGEYNE